MNIRTIKFTTKLFTGTFAILVLAITLVVAVTTMDVRKGLFQLGQSSIESTAASVFNSLNAQNSLLLEKLAADMVIFESELDSYGSFDHDASQQLEQTVMHQVTRTQEQVSMPALMLGDRLVNDNTEIVDTIQNMTGGVATIFQVLEGKLLRVSTNVRVDGTTRAVGTFIPDDSPVYKAVMNGETFTGRAFVVNDWYVTTYKPVRNAGNKIVAVLFVGRKIMTPQLKEMINTTKAAGVGYFFVYTSKGEVLAHPTLEGKNLFEIPGLGETFRNHKEGFLEYEWEEAHKVTHTHYFEPWDWNIAVGLNEDQMVLGIDRAVLLHSIMVGTGAILFGIAVTLFLIRAITRPLNMIAAQSLKVAEGDYTMAFKHEARDAIGHLSDAMNTMVGRTKEMLGEITSATQALAAASTELSSISTQMTEGSTQTAGMAAAVSTATEGVTDNMTSVSAAMEQATVNMGTVAAAAEEMSATIQEIAQNSERARNTTASAVVKAQDVSGRVNELGEAARQINAVTATITAISSQTNLLALNATIEAARAGEAGRGFAVVANEIKELALQTARATDDIHDRISSIQSVTTQTVHDIDGITDVIGEMNDIVGSIATAVEEQSVTTRDIAKNVGQASAGITEINSNVAASSSMTRAVSQDIEKVRTASDEMTVSSQTVQESATELSQLAERLREQVGKFKI